MSATPSAVSVKDLTKRFGNALALDAVSFDVAPGELFGFIGPDGAGKTTLFRILVTLMVADGGSAIVLDDDVVRDLWSLRRRLGYMPGRFSLYPDLSVEENLGFFASVFGTTIQREYDRIAPIYSQLEPFKTRRADALSGGMKQKLALCCALVHKPEILFLDEPTTGVDAVSRREFWDLLSRIKGPELTIVVSTPYMDEADRCDRVALIQRGKILAIDTPHALTAAFDRPLFSIAAADRYHTLQAARGFPRVQAVYPFGATLHLTDARREVPAAQTVAELSSYLREHGVPDAHVEQTPPTIEDLFISRMGAPDDRVVA
ncbi:MAG TPA: ABC transporter ATP-binding protein [Gemmatimonadaceae bacterium]